MSISDLSKYRKLSKKPAAERYKTKDYEVDERFFKPGTKEGKISVKLRFLPNTIEDNELGYYPFKPFRFYSIETTTGKFYADAPENVKVARKPLASFPALVATNIWKKYKKTGDEQYKNLFKDRVAKEVYLCNILVIDDEYNPENNGKVFLWKIGRQINKLCRYAMGLEMPEDNPDDYQIEITSDVADVDEGLVFHLKAHNKKKGADRTRTYEKSVFLMKDEADISVEELSEALDKQYSIKEWFEEEHYEESYEDMKARYIESTGDYYDIFPEEYGEAAPARTIKREEKKPTNKKVEEEYDDDIPFDEEEEEEVVETKSSSKKSRYEDDEEGDSYDDSDDDDVDDILNGLT